MPGSRHLIPALALIAVVAAPAPSQEVHLVSSRGSGMLRHRLANQSLLARPARLVIEDAPLAGALTELRYRSGVLLVFSPSLLPGKRVTCDCEARTVESALDYLLDGTSFGYVELDHQIVIRPGASPLRTDALPALESVDLRVRATGRRTAIRPVSPTMVQEGTVAGQVIEAGTQRPLAGAQVSVPGTGIGGLTNNEGRYRLASVPAGEVTVRVQMIGYATEEQTITLRAGQSVALNFELTEQALTLDAVVVTGTPGAQQLRSLGNTVGRIQAAELQQAAPAPTFEALLSGVEPGLTVDFGGIGRTTGGANIRIRGAASMALSSQPLLYIDGVRVNGNSTYRPTGTEDSPPSRLNDLNPEEIASVEVIKGPAAATLYGTEASNGVINIITKRGTAGAPQISLRMGVGANWYPNMEKTIPSVFYRCQGTSGNCEPGEIVEFNVLKQDRIRNGFEHFRTGIPRSYGASIEGGSDQFRFYTTLDWDHDEGAMPFDWSNQLNGRANLTWTPSAELDVQFGIAGVRSTSRLGGGGDSYTLGMIWACPAPGCEAGSGTPFAVDGIYRGFLAFRPDVMRDSTFQFEEIQRSTYSLNVTHRPADWFSHRLVAGTDWTERENTDLALPINGVGHLNPQGQKEVQNGTVQFLTLDYSATATAELTPELSFATSAGFQLYRKEREFVVASSNRFATKGLETLDAGSEQSVSENFVENKTVGAYLQEQLSWLNRRFLTLAVRGDDNSAFGTNYEAVIYPKASASWVISEEPFMEGVSWLDQLRLRAAWGRAGQQPDAFAATRTLRPIAGPGGAGGLTLENFGNPDLKPEVGQEIEVGFDVSLLDGRLGTEFTYYTQTREDALIPVPVRPSTGFPGVQFRNLGEIRNAGFELQLNGAAYQGGSVGVDVLLSLSNNNSEIVSMGGAPPQVLRNNNPTTAWSQQLFVEGFPLGAIWLKRVVSADIEGSGPTAHAVNVMCEGGDILPQSTSGFPLSAGGGPAVPCADAPHVYRGTPIPPWQITGATTVTLGSNLSLYAQVDYLGGHTMIDGNIAGSHIALFRHTRAILERTDPILLGIEALGRDGRNQSGLMDASFARLRRVGATYNFPRNWAAGIGADQLSLTLSGQNLWLIWQAQDEVFGHPNIDPEVRYTAAGGTDPGGLIAYTQSQPPALKRFLATLRVTF